METSRKMLSIEAVRMYSGKLISLLECTPYTTTFVDVDLKNDGVLTGYRSLIVCKNEDIKQAIADIQAFNGCDIVEFSINSKYCHIATTERSNSFDYISFDSEDDYPVKANITGNFKYLDGFFSGCLTDGKRIPEDVVKENYEKYDKWYTKQLDNMNNSKQNKSLFKRRKK